MADWHGYVGIENLGLTQPQKATLVQSFGQLGPQAHPQPCCLNHRRTRLDGEAVIFEALFDQDDLTVASVKVWLADIFGVDPADITYTAGVFTYNTVDHLRLALFGGVEAAWLDSRNECAAYIKTNLDEWEVLNA